jgi:hypothetical protein
MVKAGLVQLPCSWVGPTSTRPGAAGCDVVVDVVPDESVEEVDVSVEEVVVEDPDCAAVVVVLLEPELAPVVEVVAVGRA